VSFGDVCLADSFFYASNADSGSATGVVALMTSALCPLDEPVYYCP